MKMIEVNGLVVHLQQNRAFVYFSNGESEVLCIEDIENKDNPEEEILRELEFRGRESIAISESVVFLV